MRPLSLPEHRLTSVPANSGTPYVPLLAKGHAEFFREFWHEFAKKDKWGIATNALAGVSYYLYIWFISLL